MNMFASPTSKEGQERRRQAAIEESMTFNNCPNCGQMIQGYGGYVSYSDGSTKKGVFERKKGYRFCCKKCSDEYWANNPGEVTVKKDKKAKKEKEKREKVEKAKTTSDKSLSDISKKCLTLGLLGVHRFAVGKFFTGLCMPGLVVFAIAMAVSNKDPGMLLIALGDVFWWLYDLCRIKAKMFTDKSGHTVREG